MSISASDRLSLALELGGRVVFALLTLAYFLGIPPELWVLDLPLAVTGLVAYLALQATLLARGLVGRDAWWVAPAAAIVDAAAILGVVASDPYAVPPTLLLVLVAALNVGLRHGGLGFVAAVGGASALIVGTLALREQTLGDVPSYALEFLLAFMLACLVYYALQAFRRSVLEAQAAQFADQDIETQLLNRRGFDNAARYLVPLHQRTQLPLVIVLASLDTRNAQPLEMTLLSRAVRQVGHVVRQRARRSDVVARLSEDEFVFMLFDTPMAGAESLARSLLDRFNAWSGQQGIDVRLTFGLVNTPEDTVAIDQLIARARSAVERAQKHPSSPAVVTAPSL